MNIPNILTAIRFLIVPVFAYFLHIKDYTIATLLFILAGTTDILDGYIARRFNIITEWGKLADPLADKFIQLTALIILTLQGKIPIPVIIIVALKEIIMVIGSLLLYRKNVVVSANWYGKLATVIFYFAIIMSIFDFPVGNLFIILAIVSTLFAFIKYSISYKKIRTTLD